MLQCNGKSGQQFLKRIAGAEQLVDEWGSGNHAGEGTGVIHDALPSLAPFPVTVVGRVGTKHQQQPQGHTHERVCRVGKGGKVVKDVDDVEDDRQRDKEHDA